MRMPDEYLADKIMDIFNYCLSKRVKPDIEVNDIKEFDIEKIRRMKEQLGIKGVILDVDDTIRKDMKKIPKCNKKWIAEVKKELKIIVVSNGVDKGVEDFFKTLGIDYIGFATKPLRGNFRKACNRMGLEPEEVLVIGDKLFEDIFGGKRNNMKTMLVKGVEDTPEDER
ncbi:MAG: YqeG family HAD IIIA-type phosphatase [Clostridia bacterium]|nr:YqeG family HAD IIIA-type phosphatase [Clostridia bacterium]